MSAVETQVQTQVQETYPSPLLEERFSVLKQSIIKPEDRNRVIESYHRLTKALEKEADLIAQRGPSSIPEINFADLQSHGGLLPENVADTARQTGCIIIRGVVPEEEASSWESELKSYTKRHKVTGFPQHDIQNFGLFWTRPQVQIRSHPNVMKVMDAVSQLWHLSRDDALFDLASQAVYADRFRIRHPSKGKSFTRSWGQEGP